MPYLLDSDVFIQAKNLHYGFDICPGFWEWIRQRHEDGLVFSVDKVKDELTAIEDSLSQWADQRGSSFFIPPDSEVLTALSETSNWASGDDRYEQVAVNGFLQRADYYLVATAKARTFTVVSHEVPSNSPKKIKIPDACISLGVQFLNPFQMLRREGAMFVLQGRRAA